MGDVGERTRHLAKHAAVHTASQTTKVVQSDVNTYKQHHVPPEDTIQAQPKYTFATHDRRQTKRALVDLEANSTQLPVRGNGVPSAQKSSTSASAALGLAGTGLGASRWAKEPGQDGGTQRPAEAYSSCKAITFGIECEHILAFRQDELEDVLHDRKIPYVRIQKTHSVRENKILLLYSQGWGWTEGPSRRRQTYPSWVIKQYEADTAGPDVLDDPQSFRSSETFGNGKKQDYIHRIYSTEAFFIAKRILTYHSLDVDICVWVDPQDSSYEPVRFKGSETDFKSAKLLRDNAWTLTRDASIIGLLKRQLIERSSVIPEKDVDIWDSHGLELVSPIFNLTSEGKREAYTQLDARVQALKNGRTHDMLESIWAGLHVHIGLNVAKYKDEHNQKLRGVLQHLAYILVAQEPLITSMFPKSRSGQPEVPRSTDINSSDDDDHNGIKVVEVDEQLDQSYRWTDAARSEDSVLAFEESYTGWANLKSNRAWVDQQSVESGKQPSDANRRSHIFQDSCHWPQIQELDPDSGNEPARCYIYNFSNIRNYLAFNPDRSSAEAPTVEFRQHECCLDVTKIRHWVDFLEAIFRKAEELYEQEGIGNTYLERHSSKYGPEFPLRSPRHLCHWLGLSDAECNYWEERQASYQEHHRLFHDEQWRKVAPSPCGFVQG